MSINSCLCQSLIVALLIPRPAAIRVIARPSETRTRPVRQNLLFGIPPRRRSLSGGHHEKPRHTNTTKPSEHVTPGTSGRIAKVTKPERWPPRSGPPQHRHRASAKVGDVDVTVGGHRHPAASSIAASFGMSVMIWQNLVGLKTGITLIVCAVLMPSIATLLGRWC